jgi:hypothetical protein
MGVSQLIFTSVGTKEGFALSSEGDTYDQPLASVESTRTKRLVR